MKTPTENALGSCFIMMPVTTDQNRYPLDRDHFKHVLDCLFLPAIERTGYEPVEPLVDGGEVIHAEIIRRLANCEMVLCDMSQLNANVFFELGIRTALNMPACLVIDDVTPAAPFDTAIVNYHKYGSGLRAWELEREIDDLAAHILKTSSRTPTANSLWKYFGLLAAAELTTAEPNGSPRQDLLALENKALRDRIQSLACSNTPSITGFQKALDSVSTAHGIQITDVDFSGDQATIYTPAGPKDPEYYQFAGAVHVLGSEHGIRVLFKPAKGP